MAFCRLRLPLKHTEHGGHGGFDTYVSLSNYGGRQRLPLKHGGH